MIPSHLNALPILANTSSRGNANRSVAYVSPIKPGINTTPHKLLAGVPQGVDRLLLMHTVSGICQRLVQRDSRLQAAGSISDFLHLLATRETRRALEQGKASTSRELEQLE